MYSDLYTKDIYLNKNIPNLFNKVIIEYDLKSANTSLCREYELLPITIIENIEKMKKKDRVVTIGKIQKKDNKFKDELKKSFIDIRKRFFESNDIQFEDILSIKKDAIFCLKEMDHTKFGKCNFVKKNEYTSYMYINRLEFYYRKVFSSNEDDTIIRKHDGFMIKFFKEFFNKCETADIKTQLRFLRRFIDKYKHLELEVGYYREFNQNSIIRLNDSDEVYDDEMFIPYEHRSEHVDIDYNFFNILLPIVQMII